jgi:hypothetical protein
MRVKSHAEFLRALQRKECSKKKRAADKANGKLIRVHPLLYFDSVFLMQNLSVAALTVPMRCLKSLDRFGTQAFPSNIPAALQESLWDKTVPHIRLRRPFTVGRLPKKAATLDFTVGSLPTTSGRTEGGSSTLDLTHSMCSSVGSCTWSCSSSPADATSTVASSPVAESGALISATTLLL